MNEQGGIIVDSTQTNNRQRVGKQIKEVMNARAYTEQSNAVLSQAVPKEIQSLENAGINEQRFEIFNKKLNEASAAIEKMIKTGTEEQKARALAAKELMKDLGIRRDLNDAEKQYRKAVKTFTDAVNDGTGTWEELTDAVDQSKLVKDLIPNLSKVIKTLTKDIDKLDESTIKNAKVSYSEGKQNAEYNSSKRKEKKSKDKSIITIGETDIKPLVKDSINKIGNAFKGAIDTLNLTKLTQAVERFAPTVRQELQMDLQTTYGLSSGEFESFKRDLYGQIDRSLYTDQDIKNAMKALNTTALGSTKTATAYFKDLVMGQKVLGLSAETQKKLLELGNLTGRNELTFYQNQVAKYLNSSLGLNKQQLNELVSLNANLQTQAADIGIATEEFRQMSMNETSAFESTTPGFGAKYTQAVSSLMANTETTAALLGISSGEFSERAARGESIIDMLRNGQGSREAINILKNGTAKQQTEYYEYAKSALGIDANMWTVLRTIAQQEKDLNKNLKTATDASKQSGEAATKKLEDKAEDSLTIMQKISNNVQKFVEQYMPWQIINTITSVGTAIVMAISAINATSSIGDLLSLFGGGDKATKVAKAAKGAKGIKGAKAAKGAGGLLSKIKIGKATGLKALGGAGLIATGTAIGIGDAFKTADYSDEKWLGAARGFAFGTGHSKQSTGDAWGSALGNGAKWGAIGAGIGTFIAPGVGTAIGAGIGLVGGTILGGLAHLMDKKEKTEEEKAKEKQAETAAYLEEIRQNTATTALNTAKSGIGMSFLYRGKSNYSVGVGSPAGIGGKGESTGLKYGVTSSYGQRAPVHVDTNNDGIKDSWTQPFHSGTDFGAPEGTPLYSNVTGTVASTGKDGAGANYVGVTGPGGYTHWYWHMMKPAVVSKGQHVVQGQLVGYVGHTGVNAGSHLHYTVTKPGRLDWWQRADPAKGIEESTVNSLPFATPSIFDGNGSYAAYLPTEGSTIQSDLSTSKGYTLTNSHLGDIAAPIVNSIGDLKQTIIDLSNRTSRNEQIMNSLVNRTMQSPTV